LTTISCKSRGVEVEFEVNGTVHHLTPDEAIALAHMLLNSALGAKSTAKDGTKATRDYVRG
jgi:hypothetical protein